MKEEVTCILNEEKKHFKDILLNKEKALEEELKTEKDSGREKELETVKNILKNIDTIPKCD
jgi:hypothetical protein